MKRFALKPQKETTRGWQTKEKLVGITYSHCLNCHWCLDACGVSSWRILDRKKKLMATILPENHRLLADAKLFAPKAKLLWRAFRHINNPSSATTFYFCEQLSDHSVTCETEHPQDQHASAGQSWLEILQKGAQPASWIPAGREHGSALGGDSVSHLFSQRKSCHGGGR